MDYKFGAARKLFEDKKHPRVLFGTEDLPELRRILRSHDGRKIASAFRKSVSPTIRRVLDIKSHKNSRVPQYPHMGSAWNIAMLTVLDENENALEAVRRILAACPAAEKKSWSEPQARHRLGCSSGGVLARAYDLVQPLLSPKERLSFCRWAYKAGVKKTLDDLLPQYYQGPAANIPLRQFLNALDILFVIDGEKGIPDLKHEWDRALAMLGASLNTLSGPEGYPAEDMGYGTGWCSHIAQSVEPLYRAGILDVYTQCPRYAEFGNAMLHFVQPWGCNLSTTGDHGDDIGARVFVLARLAIETDNPALLWLLGTVPYGKGEIRLRKGMQVEKSIYSLLMADQFRKAIPPWKMNPPPATQFRDRDRGIVTFRSGWNKDATFVVFDGSQRCPAAAGHDHASCGHFSISAFGEYLAIDTGRYNMEQNCHNVVLIDGKSGRTTNGEWEFVKHAGVLTDFAPGRFVDTASVDSSLQHNCFWARRHLALVKGRGAPAYVWVVDDINKNNDWAEYWWQLHTCPENTIRLHKQHATITGWQYGNKLDVHFALPDREEYDRPHRLLGLTQDEAEPSSYKYVGRMKKGDSGLPEFARPADQIHYSTFIRPRLIAKIAGYNGRFMSIMLPRAKGMQPAKVKRLKSLPGSLAVRITFEKVEDTVIFAHEHRLLEAGDVKRRGHWCVIRRNRKTGKIIDCADE